MKKQKIFFMVLLCLCVVLATASLLFAQAESISFTSYYPSPFGAYQKVRFVPTTVPPDCGSSDNQGTVYFDKTTEDLQVCNDLGGGVYAFQPLAGNTSVWTQDGSNNIYPTDTASNPNLRVGIGTITPGQPLEVAASEAVIRMRNIGQTWGVTSGGFIEFYDSTIRGGWLGYGGGFDENLYLANERPNKGIRFATGGPTRMTITNVGNVGIGTTAPKTGSAPDDNRFEVNMGNNNNYFAVRNDGNVGLELRSGTNFGTPYIDFSNDATSDYDMRIRLLSNSLLGVESTGGVAFPFFLGITGATPNLHGFMFLGHETGPGTLIESAPLSGNSNLRIGSLAVVGSGISGDGSMYLEGNSGNGGSPRIGIVDTWLTGDFNTAPAWHIDNFRDAFRIFRQPNYTAGGNTWLTIDNTGRTNIIGPLYTPGGVYRTTVRPANQTYGGGGAHGICWNCAWGPTAGVGGSSLVKTVANGVFMCPDGEYVCGLNNLYNDCNGATDNCFGVFPVCCK